MKFKVDKGIFQKAISTVEGIIPARDIRSVISNVLIETQGDKIVLTATDLEMGIKTSVPAVISEKGSTTLPARKLIQVIREYNCPEINFSSNDEHKIILQDASGDTKAAKTTIMGSSSEDYPVIPTLSDEKYLNFPPAVSMEMIRKTSYAVAEEDSRYVFNGLYISNKDKNVTFVGTDGRRLSRISREFPDTLPFEKGIILPGKAVKEIQKLLDSGETGMIAFEARDRRVYFRIGDVDLICKLIDGQYPDYEQVIPKKVDHTVKLSRVELEQAIRQVAVMAAEPSRQVRFAFNSEGITFNATTPDLGESQAYMPCEYSGEEVMIAFNSGYVIDIIKSLNTEQISLGFSSASSPATLKDPDDKDFISVIMPMKI